jgi:tellurite resistance protein TerC
LTDLLFAVDSIPAIFGVTTDPFIVFTSNIFAILGLRALYFLLADLMDRFEYLPYGLGAVLVFIGLKMLGHHWVEVPIEWSLGVVVLLLGGSIVISALVDNRKAEHTPAAFPEEEPRPEDVPIHPSDEAGGEGGEGGAGRP